MTKATPAGQQPPGSNWFPLLTRLLWLASLVILWHAERLRSWAITAQEEAY